jgi:high-affinity nickel-transport protein
MIRRFLGGDGNAVRPRILATVAGLLGANLAAWGWALVQFRHLPWLLGTALLAYGLGLRHAVDADHIAAIDNVTRKLMQDGKRPVCVGLFFSLGHSSIVVLASVAIAATEAAFKDRLAAIQATLGPIGTLVSLLFLLAIAVMNIAIFASVLRARRGLRSGTEAEAQAFDPLFAGRGLLARVLRPLFRMITRSWQMYPLGLLFGLGFDTATEVGLLGISATEASHGLPVWSILVFPALFTAGMSLVDTLDGILMLGAYGWALVEPLRKLYYNLAITLASAVVAILVGGIEALGLAASFLHRRGGVWDVVGLLNSRFATLGYLILLGFTLCWGGSMLAARLAGRRPEKPACVQG